MKIEERDPDLRIRFLLAWAQFAFALAGLVGMCIGLYFVVTQGG